MQEALTGSSPSIGYPAKFTVDSDIRKDIKCFAAVGIFFANLIGDLLCFCSKRTVFEFYVSVAVGRRIVRECLVAVGFQSAESVEKAPVFPFRESLCQADKCIVVADIRYLEDAFAEWIVGSDRTVVGVGDAGITAVVRQDSLIFIEDNEVERESAGDVALFLEG